MPRHRQREAKCPKSGPMEAQSGTKDGPRGALGGKNGAQGTSKEAFWRQKLIKNMISVDSGENLSEKVDFAKIVVLLK